MKSKKVYQNPTKQLKIDAGIHKLLRIAASKQETTIKKPCRGIYS
jgi:hypothetical protein